MKHYEQTCCFRLWSADPIHDELQVGVIQITREGYPSTGVRSVVSACGDACFSRRLLSVDRRSVGRSVGKVGEVGGGGGGWMMVWCSSSPSSPSRIAHAHDDEEDEVEEGERDGRAKKCRLFLLWL